MADGFQRDQGIPLHHQLSGILRSNITSGRYAFGVLLPGETTLMTHYGVSRATVRRALLSIEAEGLVRRQQGKGTQVCWQPLPLASAERRARSEGSERIYAGTRVRVLDQGAVLASAEVAEELGLDAGERVYRIERLRLAGLLPLWHLTNYLPLEIAEALGAGALEASALVAALDRSGRMVDRAEDRIGAVLADSRLSGHLRLPLGAALTEVSRVLVTSKGDRLAFQKILIVPERHKLRLVVDTRNPGPDQALDEAGIFAEFLNQ